MEYIRDLMYVNKEAISKTTKGLKDNLLFLAVGIIFYAIELVSGYLMALLLSGPTAIIGGFLNAFVRSAIYSSYLYVLFNIIVYRRLNINDIKRGFSYFLWKVYGVFFIIYLAQMVLSLLGNIFGSAASILNLLIMLGAFILFNALPEAIYLRNYSSIETLSYAMEFIKENWFNWFVPNIIFVALLFVLQGNGISNFFSVSISNLSIEALKNTIPIFIGRIMFSVFMLYRGFLFNILSSSTRRKRMFMNR